nr:universal stress protein [Dechloromonas sp.]
MGNLSELRHLEAMPGLGVQRLLLPIDASEEGGWGIRHAIRLAGAGAMLEVCLAYVVEPVHNWEVLRFYSREEVIRHFKARATVFLTQAAAPLAAADIPTQGSFQELGPARSLGDLASDLHCSAIVLPHCRWLGLFPYGPWHRLARMAGTVPVIETDAGGMPA